MIGVISWVSDENVVGIRWTNDQDDGVLLSISDDGGADMAIKNQDNTSYVGSAKPIALPSELVKAIRKLSEKSS